MLNRQYNTVFLGTELKLNLSIDPIGDLTMDDYDFKVEAYCSSRNVIRVYKANATKVDEKNYIIPVDTGAIGTGALKCKVTAYIEDPDFKDDGIRTEVVVVNTGINIVKGI